MGGRREVSIIFYRPVTRSDLKQERSFFRGSVSSFLQLVVARAGLYKNCPSTLLSVINLLKAQVEIWTEWKASLQDDLIRIPIISGILDS